MKRYDRIRFAALGLAPGVNGVALALYGLGLATHGRGAAANALPRSEERRVGKEC